MELLFGMPNSLTGASVFLYTGVDGEGSLLAAYDDMLCDILYSKITQAQTPSQIQGEDVYKRQPLARSARMISTASSVVTHMGFSSSTCTP